MKQIEPIRQPLCLAPCDERIVRFKWIKESLEFGNKYNVIIRLIGSIDRCNNKVLTIEMTHRDDPKNTVRYRKLGYTYINPRDRISYYFEHLYEKLPIVRRNKWNIDDNEEIK